jgi:hypothetical protein
MPFCKTRRRKCRATTLLLLLSCAALASGAKLISAHSRAQLPADVSATLDAIRAGDPVRLAKYVSSHGLIIVRRMTDWKQTGVPLAEKHAKSYLSLDHLEPLVWTEYQVHFGKSELRNSKEFRAIISQMKGFIGASFPGSLRYCADMEDHWQSRHLGPAVEGKLVSNVYWYACFTREDGHLRLYRFELDAH